jgi:hypothetical protein
MPAYFSSKFKKQIQVALSIALLAICLLGTRSIGLSHSISHANFQSQAEVSAIALDSAPSQNHSSDICHLFDALTLAGFVSSDNAASIAHVSHSDVIAGYENDQLAQDFIGHYQSRAPPPLIS